MTDTLAYQIGAAFFLAVLLMAGTMTRGLFPSGVLKNVKLTMLATAALLAAWAIRSGLPDLSSVVAWRLKTDETPAGSSPAAAAKEPKPAIQPTSTAHLRPSTPAVLSSAPAQPIPEEPAHIQVSQTAVVSDSGAAPVSKNRNPITRAAKSVRHFLHIGPEKYQQPQAAPVPVSIEESNSNASR